MPAKRQQPGRPPAERQTVQRVEHRSEMIAAYRGPIPPPEILEGFERVVPGAGERILAMAEREQANKHARQADASQLDAQTLTFSYGLMTRSQWMGFVILLLTLYFGSSLLYLGHDVTGLATVFTSLTAIVIALYVTKKQAMVLQRPPSPDGASQ